MKKLIKITGVILIMMILCFAIHLYTSKKTEYTKNIYYMDTYIYVKIFSNNKNKADNVLNKVEQIYSEYHQLTDRYNHYDNIINLYDIFHNNLSSETLTLDSKLYDLLSYADEWHQVYNKLNIEMGNIIDIWKSYRENKNGIPHIDELRSANVYSNLVLLDNNTILNNHPNLDLGAIAKGYTTQIVGEYLESVGIDEYLINAGGNVKVGKNYERDYYKIGVQSPISTSEILTVINGNDISVITSGGYERNYEYDDKIYHHIIDPDTLYPSDYMKSVTVIAKDSALGDVLSTILFLMSVEEGQNFIKQYDVEALWYTNDDQIIRSENFSNYE